MNKNSVVHLMHPDIVDSHDTSQKNRDKTDTHHYNGEPVLETRRCEEALEMIPRQTEEQIGEHPPLLTEAAVVSKLFLWFMDDHSRNG